MIRGGGEGGALAQLIYAAALLLCIRKTTKYERPQVLRSHCVCTWKLQALKGLAAGND